MASQDSVNKELAGTPAEEAARTREAVKALSQKLRDTEAKNLSGAAPRSPRSGLLDIRELQAMHPEVHYRYVNMTDPQKVRGRRNRGYVPVTDEEAKEGGVDVRIGSELVLMKLPREEYERLVSEQKRINKERLKAHQSEATKAAEAIVRELKDKHGLDVPLERFLVTS